MFAVMTLFTYVWHANSLWVTLIPVAYALPSILLSQAAGNLADRYNKVQLMFLSELVRLLFTCLLFFTNEPLLALGVLTLRSMSSVMKVPAQLAYVREVVKEDQLLQASTLQNIMFQIAKVVGPFLGAAALTFTTPKTCILVNAAACMISIWVLFSLKKQVKIFKGKLLVLPIKRKKRTQTAGNSFFSTQFFYVSLFCFTLHTLSSCLLTLKLASFFEMCSLITRKCSAGCFLESG